MRLMYLFLVIVGLVAFAGIILIIQEVTKPSPLDIGAQSVPTTETEINQPLSSVNDVWYVGKGAKNDMYLTYKVADRSINFTDSYELTVLLTEDIPEIQDFNASILVVYNSSGTTKVLSASYIDMSRSLFTLDYGERGAVVQNEIKPFLERYRHTLARLNAYATLPTPESLSSVNSTWTLDVAGCHKAGPDPDAELCNGPRVAGLETISVPAGTFNATLLTMQNADGKPFVKTWINKDLPYPIKEQKFDTEQADLTQYEFELIEVGQRSPHVP